MLYQSLEILNSFKIYDSVFGNGNAGSPVGAYASSAEWDYDKEVAYGFGYGLSYTDFTQEFEGEPEFNVSTDPVTGVCDATAVFHVKVTNTGDIRHKFRVFCSVVLDLRRKYARLPLSH